jgi:hypothetical protein
MRQVLAFLGVFAVVGLALALVFRTPLMVPVAFVLVLVAPLSYGRFVGRPRRASQGLYWRGFMSFMESSLLADTEVFPDIRWQERPGGWGRAGLCAGKGEIRDSGVTWRSGAWGTPQTEISGRFELPWSVVEAAEAYRLPGKIPGLGGGITFTLSGNRGMVKGQFLGSIRALSNALESSRRAASDAPG